MSTGKARLLKTQVRIRENDNPNNEARKNDERSNDEVSRCCFLGIRLPRRSRAKAGDSCFIRRSLFVIRDLPECAYDGDRPDVLQRLG